jgi:hypothetical protein
MLVLIARGKKLKKWGYSYYIEVGKNWGGLELGMFFLTCENPSDSLKCHEFGHGIQNCYFGWTMPFVVSIPSAIRYWYRTIRSSLGHENKGNYDDAWFEGQASELGKYYIERINNGTRKAD